MGGLLAATGRLWGLILFVRSMIDYFFLLFSTENRFAYFRSLKSMIFSSFNGIRTFDMTICNLSFEAGSKFTYYSVDFALSLCYTLYLRKLETILLLCLVNLIFPVALQLSIGLGDDPFLQGQGLLAGGQGLSPDSLAIRRSMLVQVRGHWSPANARPKEN